jgi:hypothetical protein
MGELGMMRGLILVFAIECGVGLAQQPGAPAQPIGTVEMQHAMVSGVLQVSNGQALLVGNTTVTARDRTADVALSRGGTVHVCATSGLHLTAGKSAMGTMPLMLALDRGAIEVQTPGTTSDVVMTPDLRFTLRSDGPLDLQLRVTRNGDTCVENRGAKAPVLSVAEQFGDATYELRAGQHVLFEHGSLKEVVDHESSPCGCPPVPETTVADALIAPAATGTDKADAAKSAAAQHPFPAAVSEELAPAAAVPQTPPGTVHAQVSATLSSGGAPDSTTDPTASRSTVAEGSRTQASTAGAAAETPSPAAQPAPPRGGLVHAVGRFFKRLFGGG